MSDAGATVNVLIEVAAERTVQRGRWGNDHDDHHRDSFWLAILVTYVGRLAGYIIWERPMPTQEAELRRPLGRDLPVTLRAGLVKVAATAVAWIEAIDRRAS